MKKNFIFPFLLLFTITCKAQVKHYPHFSFSAGTGPAHMLVKSPADLGPEFEKYMDDLKSGWQGNFTAKYNFNRYAGAGIHYSYFGTRNADDSVTAQSGIFKITGSLHDTLRIHTLTAMAFGRWMPASGSCAVVAGAGPAALRYWNSGKAIMEQAVFTGYALGLHLSGSAEFRILKIWYAGLSADYTRAFLKAYTKETELGTENFKLEKENYQDISRLDVSIRLTFSF